MVFKAIRIISCKKVNMVRAQCSVPTLCDCLMSPSATMLLGKLTSSVFENKASTKKCFTMLYIQIYRFWRVWGSCTARAQSAVTGKSFWYTWRAAACSMWAMCMNRKKHRLHSGCDRVNCVFNLLKNSKSCSSWLKNTFRHVQNRHAFLIGLAQHAKESNVLQCPATKVAHGRSMSNYTCLWLPESFNNFGPAPLAYWSGLLDWRNCIKLLYNNYGL